MTTTTTTNSKIRLAHFREQHALAHICTSAFFNDVLFGNHIHPYRKRYPGDMGLYFLRRIQIGWWDWTHKYVVAVERDSNGREVVAGFASWCRLGRAEGMALAWWDVRTLLQPLAALYTRLCALLHPNRALDPRHETVFEDAHPFVAHVWTGARAECWDLEWLCVHPDYEKRGHGRALVAWGLQQAARENVAASVVCAPGTETFYRRCGFDMEDSGYITQGEGNPMADIPGGWIMFKDAKKAE